MANLVISVLELMMVIECLDRIQNMISSEVSSLIQNRDIELANLVASDPVLYRH